MRVSNSHTNQGLRLIQSHVNSNSNKEDILGTRLKCQGQELCEAGSITVSSSPAHESRVRGQARLI